MADTQAKLVRRWAPQGDRQLPEDLGLSRDTGWTVPYEQIGAGAEPERTLFNQLLLELTELFEDTVRRNILPWDRRIDYPGSDSEGYAFVTGPETGVLYVSNRPNGPALGNPTNPETPDQDVWDTY